jgi:repressor LexA
MGEKILAFVEAFIEEHGYSPNFREIGYAVGINSTSHVAYWIDKLVADGKLTKAPNISRSVRVA